MHINNWLATGLILVVFAASCGPAKKVTAPPTPPPPPPPVADVQGKEDPVFATMLKNYPALLDSMLQGRNSRNIQVIYTAINRDDKGKPSLQKYYFNHKEDAYFYPASTVKLPVALLALQKLKELNIPGLDRNTTMITEAAYSGQTPAYNDPNTATGKPTIAQYIKKILLVSDNDAYNRLYEFLGQEYINSSMAKKGYTKTQILHRLDIFLTEDENRHTNPVRFVDAYNKLVYSKPLLFNKTQYAARKDFLGNGYYSNGQLVNGAMNFSKKNRITLDELNSVLMSVIFPDAVPASQRFDISEEDRQFVLQYMSQYPSESYYPAYDSSYNDAYVKFLMYGAENKPVQPHIRIFNKVGDAYGQLTDVAYVADFKNNIEFMLSATIYCNSDGVLNDDKYDYSNVGFPFMKNLGKAVYEYELGRKRNFKPDLSSLIFTYNK